MYCKNATPCEYMEDISNYPFYATAAGQMLGDLHAKFDAFHRKE